MLLPWYGASASFGGVSASANASAWKAFSFIDILLFLVILVAIGLVVARASGNIPDLPQPPGLIVAAAGAFAVVLILFRLLVVPDGGVDVEGVDFSRKFGVFLGLIAAAGHHLRRLDSDERARERAGGGLGERLQGPSRRRRTSALTPMTKSAAIAP